MTTPRHHVPDELITAYCTGAAPEPVALFVATHASLCSRCAVRIAAEEAIGGALLADAPHVSPDPGLRDRVLARLDEPAPAEPAPSAHPLFPRPLLGYLPTPAPWRRVLPGLDVIELPLRLGEQPVVLTRLGAGARIPRHDHAGLELQLVLSGGYLADEGRFGRGDAHCADPSVTHGFRIDPDEPCVTLLVREARIRPHGLLGALFARLSGA